MERIEKSKMSDGNTDQWNSALKHIENFDQVNIYPDQIHERWMEDLKKSMPKL